MKKSVLLLRASQILLDFLNFLVAYFAENVMFGLVQLNK